MEASNLVDHAILGCRPSDEVVIYIISVGDDFV